MPNITPAQLQPATLITDSDIFIVQQGNVVAKTTFADIRSVIWNRIATHVDSVVASNMAAINAQLAALTVHLISKANAAHSHTKADIGLGNVADIAPLNLPISTATQQALDLKVDIGNLTSDRLTIASPGPEW